MVKQVTGLQSQHKFKTQLCYFWAMWHDVCDTSLFPTFFTYNMQLIIVSLLELNELGFDHYYYYYYYYYKMMQPHFAVFRDFQLSWTLCLHLLVQSQKLYSM